jgi:hypothetical protein
VIGDNRTSKAKFWVHLGKAAHEAGWVEPIGELIAEIDVRML